MNSTIDTCDNCENCVCESIDNNVSMLTLTANQLPAALTGSVSNTQPTIHVTAKKLTATATLPAYQTTGAGAADVYADLAEVVEIAPGQSALVSTGMAFAVPADHIMLVFSRSGHGIKNRISLANCVGVIDSDYRGELKIAVANSHPTTTFTISDKDRIAQIATIYAPQMTFELCRELAETARGTGGFGSTDLAFPQSRTS